MVYTFQKQRSKFLQITMKPNKSCIGGKKYLKILDQPFEGMGQLLSLQHLFSSLQIYSNRCTAHVGNVHIVNCNIKYILYMGTSACKKGSRCMAIDIKDLEDETSYLCQTTLSKSFLYQGVSRVFGRTMVIIMATVLFCQNHFLFSYSKVLVSHQMTD